jgi:acyl-CoA synthetase (AMP-forming)/AMP-acid ligase II
VVDQVRGDDGGELRGQQVALSFGLVVSRLALVVELRLAQPLALLMQSGDGGLHVECAVIWVPDKKWGETVKAVVVKRAGSSLTEKALVEWCRDKIAGYKLQPCAPPPGGFSFLPGQR